MLVRGGFVVYNGGKGEASGGATKIAACHFVVVVVVVVVFFLRERNFLTCFFICLDRPSTCSSAVECTCIPLKSFAGLWRTSNKYKLCPTKIDRSLTSGLSSTLCHKSQLMVRGNTGGYCHFFFFFSDRPGTLKK